MNDYQLPSWLDVNLLGRAVTTPRLPIHDDALSRLS